MKYAIIVKQDGEEHAIIKTEHADRVNALAALCAAHIGQVCPDMAAVVSVNRSHNAMVAMHPDKEWIIERLREAEFPLPKNQIVIEGICQ